MSAIRHPMPVSGYEHAALEYANRGWYVFPLRYSESSVPRSRKPQMPAKNVRDAHQRLRQEWDDFITRDEEKIHSFWRQDPGLNIGIATGERSGLLVLHVDKSYLEVRQILEQLPETVTAGAGNITDYYFKMPPGHDITEKTGSLPSGIHVRANGQYVEAPPSTPPHSRQWEWIYAPSDMPLAELPDAVLERLLGWPTPATTADGHPRQQEEQYIARALDWMAQGIHCGECVYRLAFDLYGAGLDMVNEADPIVRRFAEAARAAGKTGFTDSEAMAALKSGYQAAALRHERRYPETA